MIRSVLAMPIDDEPLTLDQGKLRAGLDWLAGDPRDELMLGFIAAARNQVEQDTGLAVPVQTRDLFLDVLPNGVLIPWSLWPTQTRPLIEVTTVTAIDSAGDSTEVGFTALASNDGLTVSVPTVPVDVYGGWIVRIVSGFETIPPSLVQAVGLLTGHYATAGRDLTILGDSVAPTPLGYDEAIRAFVVMSLA